MSSTRRENYSAASQRATHSLPLLRVKMNVTNQPPPIGADAEALPPMSYLALANAVGAKEGSIGYQWAKTNADEAWGEVLSVTQIEAAKLVANANELKTRVGGFGDSLAPVHLLVMHEGKLKVLYGWKPCRVLAGLPRRQAGHTNHGHAKPRMGNSLAPISTGQAPQAPKVERFSSA